MPQVQFTEEVYHEIILRLTRLEAMLKSKQGNPDTVFLDNQEFLQIMNVSKRTAQAWRDEKIIAFSQIGNKIYYTMGDIMQLLQKNRVEASR